MEKDEILEGFDEKILKSLSKDKELTITKIRRTFQVGFMRAKEMWKALREGKEHVCLSATYREYYFTQERLEYWGQRGAGIFELGDFGEESQEKSRAIRGAAYKLKKHSFDFYIFDTKNPQKLLKHFVLVYDAGGFPCKFFEDLQMMANSFTAGKFYVLDGERGMIYERSFSTESPCGYLNTTTLDEILGVDRGLGQLIHFPCGIARMGMGFVFYKKENPFKNAKKTRENVENFKKISTKEELDTHFDARQNSYVFLEDAFINFDFSNPNVNILGKNLCAKNLQVRKITLDGGLFVEKLDCRDYAGQFLCASKEAKCENMQCKVLKIGEKMI